jgi:hypothetical protein
MRWEGEFSLMNVAGESVYSLAAMNLTMPVQEFQRRTEQFEKAVELSIEGGSNVLGTAGLRLQPDGVQFSHALQGIPGCR